MTRPIFIAAGVIVLALIVTAYSTFFIVPQTAQALVLQFGEPRRVVAEPGLHMKVPFTQDVMFFDRRLLDIEPAPQPVTLSDKKRIEIDAYGRYRIVDPLIFFKTLNSEAIGDGRLTSIIISSIRRVLGSSTLDGLLSPDRERIMGEIQREVHDAAERFGIDMIEVRLRRADLPDRTTESVFQLMRSERDKEARELRAEGDEKAKQIRAQAESTRRIIIAKAERDAQITRGEADAKASKIYANAFAQEPQFYAFYRSMEAYRNALGASDTTFMLSPGNDFLRYFGNGKTSAAGAGPRP